MLAVTDLVVTLGGLLTVVVSADGAEVDDLTIAEAASDVVGQPHDLVLGVGIDTTAAAGRLLDAAASARVGGVVLRRQVAQRQEVRDRALESGVALVELAEQASWAHLVWLLRGVIDQAAVGPGRGGDPPVQDDLFTLADAAAIVVDAPVTIEDAQSRVLAYSSGQDLTDPTRVSTIVGRRVPGDVRAALRARGVFRRLATSAEPVFVPASGEFKPRLVVPVRAGGVWLGSIWAVVEDRPPASIAAALAQTASVVALHLLRLRAQADLPRLLAADRLRSALSGHSNGGQDWLPTGPWRVAVLEGSDAPDRLLEVWESVCRRHGWRQPLLSELDSRVYAVLRDADAPDPGTWAWLTSVVLPASDDFLGLTARAGGAVEDSGQLHDSRLQAQETSRVVASSARAATYEETWAEVTVARAAAAVAGDLLGPLALLERHDEEQHTDYLRTLAAFLDYPGAPTRAARSIHLHPNTLRYRMNRLVDLTGLDLENATVRLALQLQLASVRAQPLPGGR